MVDSRCGLHCTGCAWKESHGCGGCIETMGHPFHGECPIAICCQGKGWTHCGECDIIPCDKLYGYSYLDPVHGDKPQGERVTTCRHWAAEQGKHRWEHVLLTSAGWCDGEGRICDNIRARFLEMLGKPVNEAKVLFIPAAAIDEDAKRMVPLCADELLQAGILPEYMTTYDLDGTLSAEEAMAYDVVYFTGGSTRHLLKCLKETGFDVVVKKMVYANKVFVGVSAGSLIATPNIGEAYDEATAGLCLIHAYPSVHCPEGKTVRQDLPLPHIPLTDRQALAVRWSGWEIISD